MDLAEYRTEEQIIWVNAVVNVLMSEDEVTPKQRKDKNSKIMKRFNNKLRGSANLVKYWATGDNRPGNASFVGFDSSYYKSGKVTLPKYFQ